MLTDLIQIDSVYRNCSDAEVSLVLQKMTSLMSRLTNPILVFRCNIGIHCHSPAVNKYCNVRPLDLSH